MVFIFLVTRARPPFRVEYARRTRLNGGGPATIKRAPRPLHPTNGGSRRSSSRVQRTTADVVRVTHTLATIAR